MTGEPGVKWASRPSTDERAQDKPYLVSGSGNVTICSPGWART